MGNWILIVLFVIALFIIMLVLSLLMLKKINPHVTLEEDLEINRIHLNDADLEFLVGKEGVVITDLKPGGKCRIDGIEFEVRAENGRIEKGERIRISRIHGNKIMAKEI